MDLKCEKTIAADTLQGKSLALQDVNLCKANCSDMGGHSNRKKNFIEQRNFYSSNE